MKVIIVGGVAGGATAAARIRRLDEKAEITVFERSGYVSYANCGLPYYIGGIIEDSKELTLQTPESFMERFQIKMKVRHEVTAIHPERKTVSVKIWKMDRNLRKHMTNCCFLRERFPQNHDCPAWNCRRYLRSAPWKTP